MTASAEAPAWARWSDERLLDLRFCDLGVDLAGTAVQRLIDRVHAELKARNLEVRPHFWLSDEWFSPEGIPGVAVPFYLAHPRLARLERTMMLTVEGGSNEECTKILRHEVGHAIQHAYALHRKRGFQKTFGKSSLPYPEHYRPNPASKHHVVHLDHWYGQSHPDEDFAETFAVWLKPGSRWRTRYAGWPALKKLEFLDRLMAGLAGLRPPVRSRARIAPLSQLRHTLRQHYDEKRERYVVDQPNLLDRELGQVFTDAADGHGHPTAAAFLRRHRSEIRRRVSRWTGEYQFTLDQVLKEMIERCTQLRLRAVGDEHQLILDFSILLTAKTMQYLYRLRQWHAL